MTLKGMSTCLVAALCLATLALAEGSTLTAPQLAEGSVDPEQGLAAWDRMHAVFSHPRCANCHVDAQNVPLWSVAGQAQMTRPHGMNIHAGESRNGSEHLPCTTCHVTSNTPNDVPHAPPHAGIDWQLAPVEFVWTDRTSAEICAQIRDPDRNGGRDLAGLVKHVTHDADVGGFITWGFTPGGGREPAPFGMQAHLDDIVTWGAAGMPCPVE